jgi:hypothetical protein
VARPDTVAFSERDQVRRPWLDNYSADMSNKRPELPGTAGNAVTVKKVVPQGLMRFAGILKNRRSEIRELGFESLRPRGAARADVTPDDITAAVWALRGVIQFERTDPVHHGHKLWRRHLETILRGFRSAPG